MIRRFASFVNKRRKPLLIGVVHLKPLPGTPNHALSVNKIVEHAIEDTLMYKNVGVDGIILENMGDVPYVQPTELNPETVAIMSRCALEIRNSVNKTEMENILWGVAILASCNKEALAVALANNFDFVRCEGFVFAHVADEGMTDACAGTLLRYRKSIGADKISVLTDIKKKHSAHSITADVDLGETAEAAKFFLSDGVIITGPATGHAPSVKELEEVKSKVTDINVIVGSGVTAENVCKFANADALIVGSYFKKDGFWSNPIDRERLNRFMDAFNMIRR